MANTTPQETERKRVNSSLVQCADCCNEQEDEESDGDDNATWDSSKLKPWDPSKLIPCNKDFFHSKDSINDQERIQTEEREDSANGLSTMCSDRCLPNILPNVNSDFKDFVDFSKDQDPVQTEKKEEKGTISTCVTNTSPNLCIPDVSVYASSDCTKITRITETSMAQCVKFFYDKDDAEYDNEWICMCATKNSSKQCTSCGKRNKLPDHDEVDVEDLEDDDEEEEKEEFRMLIAGIRGVGKSALANSIAGYEIQDSKADFGTVTKMATKIKRKLNDRSLIYFDTPGLSKDMEEGRVVEAYNKCLVKAAPGLHAILIVQKATTFTDDNHHFLETFTKRFGEKSWKFVLFVFTHIDELDEDLKVQLENGDTRLHGWLKKCDGRYIGINNMIHGPKNQQQILRLLSAVDSLVKKNNEEIYTNEEFQKIYEVMKKAAQSRNVTVQYVREHYADSIIQQHIQQAKTAILSEFFHALF